MREAGGDDMDIIIEMHSLTDTVAAIQVAQALEDLRIFIMRSRYIPLTLKIMQKWKSPPVSPSPPASASIHGKGIVPSLKGAFWMSYNQTCVFAVDSAKLKNLWYGVGIRQCRSDPRLR